MVLQPGTNLGQYEILSSLGAGGMGEVYRAQDKNLGREVAIKLLLEDVSTDPARIARFKREARVLASLNHTNIATLHGFESQGDTNFLVMELVEGETLAERIARGPIPVEKAIPLFLQIAEGLEAAHLQGIIHRDLKPANIKFTSNGATSAGHLKILDFGLAKASRNDTSADEGGLETTMTVDRTVAGAVLGTPAYMSPEQWRGEPADQRVDIWAFGCVLFEMLVGKKVFAAQTGSEVAARVLEREPDWSALPTATPPGIRRLLRRCLSKDAAERLHDIADARIEIDEVIRGTEEELAPRIEAGRSRFGAVLAAVAVAAVLGAGATWLVLRGSQSGSESRDSHRDVRFLFSPPEGVLLSDLSGLAVSPDGEQIVYVAFGSGTPASLWVRHLDSLESLLLPGTEGALHPFWSPDSATIGFFANRKLQLVEAVGGPPRELSDVEEARGGTWSQAGVILLAPDVYGGLFVISPSGGELRRVTMLDEERGEASHRWPSFLPDGRRFVVWVAGADTHGIYLGSLDSEDLTLLVQADGNARVVVGENDSLELLYMRSGTVLRQVLDVEQRAVKGTPEVVAEGVWQNLYAWGLTGFSVSSGGVFVHRGGGMQKTRLQWFDRSGQLLSEVGQPDLFIEMSYSAPAGAAIITRTARANVVGELWRMDLSRGSLSLLSTSEVLDVQGSVWSRDGRSILLSARRRSTLELYVQNSDGSSAENLLYETQTVTQPYDWSPDGRFVLYGEKRGGTMAESVMDLWLLPVSSTLASQLERSGEPVLLVGSDGDDWAGRFSPDGRWVAYTSRQGESQEVFVTPFPPTGQAGRIPVSTQGGGHPTWRADGRELFYMALDRTLMAVDVDTSSGFRPGRPRPLFHRSFGGNTWVFSGSDYAPAPDGQSFLVMAPAEDSSTHEIRVSLGL